MAILTKRTGSKKDACLTVCENKKRCDRDEITRGLCGSHYSTARTLVNNGETTWEQLEADGKAKPLKIKRGAKDFFLRKKK